MITCIVLLFGARIQARTCESYFKCAAPDTLFSCAYDCLFYDIHRTLAVAGLAEPRQTALLAQLCSAGFAQSWLPLEMMWVQFRMVLHLNLRHLYITLTPLGNPSEEALFKWILLHLRCNLFTYNVKK